MGKTRKEIVYPTFEDILLENKAYCDVEGLYVPPYNLENENTLRWALYQIQCPLIDLDPYPTLIDKAAVLIWSITAKHVFKDGCKRTGFSIGLGFLVVNGKTLYATEDEIETTAILVADSEKQGYRQDDLCRWLRKITRKRHVPRKR